MFTNRKATNILLVLANYSAKLLKVMLYFQKIMYALACEGHTRSKLLGNNIQRIHVDHSLIFNPFEKKLYKTYKKCYGGYKKPSGFGFIDAVLRFLCLEFEILSPFIFFCTNFVQV